MSSGEDPWERQYANYLEAQMEAQYWSDLENRYEGIVTDDEEYVVTGINNSEMTFTIASNDIPHQILHLPMEENDAHAHTVGEYLGVLLSTLWVEADGFSGKRPFGNSDWQYAVYKALAKAGLVEIVLDEDGYIEEFSADEEYKADALILEAIKLVYNHE